MIIRIIFGIMLFIIFTVPAKAEMTGNELLRDCNAAISAVDGKKLDEVQKIDSLNCMAYISGFIDSGILHRTYTEYALEALQINQDITYTYCLPDKYSFAQLARVTVKYLKDHPEVLHESYRSLLWGALGSAFPCNKNKTKQGHGKENN